MADVYLDQKYIGTVDHAESFVGHVKQARREGKLPGVLNIAFHSQLGEVRLDMSSGRARRPLIIVEQGKSKLTDEMMTRLEKGEIGWDYLVSNGIIEYLDAAEEEQAFIALYDHELTPEHTHLELTPLVIVGLTTSLVPYANYGQSSRLNRGSKTQKQALGFYASNFLVRMDTDLSVLNYPQNPLVRSETYGLGHLEEHPAGQNVVVALMSYEGYNMSDALVLNKGSVQRGLARSTYFRPYLVEELRYSGGLVDEIGVPDKEVRGYKSEHDYRLLEDDGVIYPEASVREDDVLIGKTSPPRFLGEMDEFSVAANKRRESSVVVRHGEEGIVDFVVVSENEEGNRLIQVRLRHPRIPEVGDKFASRHGQKGVIGLIVDQADMPFTSNGITPDVIFSPHSIPSRMTVSHLIEVLAGKVGALDGRIINGTLFGSETEQSLREYLLSLGFRENGTERLYNGITGEEFEAKIFVGNMYYLKLKHMVANKLHARASGRIQLLTRQPIEGRSKGGGLRLGEMEKDCFVAHGASLLLKERFDSDKTLVHICESCGLLAVFDSYRNNKFCHKCGGNVEITAVELSYAFKLLLDELRSLCITPKLVLRSKY